MDSCPYFFVVRGAGNIDDVLPRLLQGFQNRLRIARSATGHRHRPHRSSFPTHRMLRLVGEVRAAVVQLRDLRLWVMRIHPIVVRSLLRPLAVQPTAPVSALRSPIPRPVATETPRSPRPYPVAQSSAWLRSLPASCHRCPPSSPSAALSPPVTPVPTGIPLDAFPPRSAAACARSW